MWYNIYGVKGEAQKKTLTNKIFKVATLQQKGKVIMRIRGTDVKGIKKTVGIYNKLPISERKSFNIWLDNETKTVMLIRNDIFEQCGMDTERYEDKESGLLYLRYDDISDIIKDEYPDLEYKNISMPMLANILRIYLI